MNTYSRGPKIRSNAVISSSGPAASWSGGPVFRGPQLVRHLVVESAPKAWEWRWSFHVGLMYGPIPVGLVLALIGLAIQLSD